MIISLDVTNIFICREKTRNNLMFALGDAKVEKKKRICH